MPIRRTLDQDFFKKWTPEMAYVLGYFAADGSMLTNNRGAHFFEFTSIDKILIVHVQKAVHSNHRIQLRKRGGNTRTSYRLQIGSKEWYTDLCGLGFTQNKSNTLKYPNIPARYQSHFVRGYFDGDGCVYFKKHWAESHTRKVWVFMTRFTSGSKRFLLQLHKTLKFNGVVGGHINTKNRSGFDLVFSRKDSLALYRFMYHTSPVSDLFLPRKREKLERAVRVLNLDKIVRE